MEVGLFKRNGEELEVEITSANEVFFRKQKDANQLEVIYQGSGIIVAMLRAEIEMKAATNIHQSKALFDVYGNFHENLRLLELRVHHSDTHGVKHVADFQDMGTERFKVFSIAVDDIHCLGNTAVKASI